MTPHSINESTRYELVGRNYNLDAPEVRHGPVRVEQYDMWMEDAEVKRDDGLEIPATFRTMDTIADQDEPIVENQRPWELPLNLAYRRFMRELGVEVDAG